MIADKTVLILSSPTASGKSHVALQVARQIPVEILSADSRQIYKYLSIGTAKPSKSDLDRVPHHCIDKLDPHEVWNAGKFAHESRRIITEIFNRNRIPFVVGGSGLYIKALVDGIIDIPETEPDLRQRILLRYESEGLSRLVAELHLIDPHSTKGIDTKNPRRVMRALEIYYSTGMTRSEIEDKSDDPIPYRVQWFGLRWDRGKLNERIENRVDRMITEGLIDETKSILEKGYSGKHNALQSVGYTETVDYIEGKISRKDMIDRIKRNTRRFAKRQMTWFRKEKRIQWIDVGTEDDLNRAAEEIVQRYRNVSQ
jgi:tRNA dimethylallyltransferase